MSIKNLTRAKAAGGYRFSARGSDRAEIYLYGVIGQDWFGDGISAKQLSEDLKKVPNAKTIDVRINSEGGDVFDGKAMYSLLQQHKARIVVHIDGLAASAASFIAMVGDEINISEGAFVMVHNAWTFAIGNSDDLRRKADLLDSVSGSIGETYAARTKQTSDKIKQWMDDETWFTGAEAVENGFADKMVENLKVAACVSGCKFRNTPSILLPRRAAALATIESLRRK
ncbi:MAG: head maturation protease, ClpP-related [Sterolibacterium sp.]